MTRTRPTHATFVRRRITVALAALVVVALVGAGIYALHLYLDLTGGLHRSALAATGRDAIAQNTGETNILIMGLDSRRDENGAPLPAAVYNALHAGDGDNGGYNANVLMLIHIPAGGGRAVGISIPRDDWTSLPGAPDGQSTGKIKQAYGFELDADLRHLRATQPALSAADAYQQARAAARQEEVTTVSDFLGGVPIEHFIEVTMAAFYELAQEVQPIEVCLNENTVDAYSGADFRAGYQQLSASQAVAFVRQRRDTGDDGVNLTDLDRERRQQAFIVSLAVKLGHENAFGDLGLAQRLIDTAKQDMAVDSGLDLLSFASDARRFAAGGITFDTLPIERFGVVDGQDVNLVDPTVIRDLTDQLIAASDASSTPAAGRRSTTPAPGASRAPTLEVPVTTPTSGPLAPLRSGAIPCVN